ncbi:MAG: acyl-CoA desaturase [Rhizobiales bacterium]|nr:acyl-CoA desaturase [Hyphomicrobiales bacterium]
MNLVPGSERIFADGETNPVEGRVRWAPAKSLWIGSVTLAAVVLGPAFFTWDAFLLFIVTSGVTLCFGHSVGMHRRLIHASFDCPLWLERFCVYLGTLVGMAGPIGMVRIHDLRDWAQRQPACHDYSRHNAGFWRDGWWQLHCRLVLKHPPRFQPEPRIAGDRFYAFVEKTWMWQQLPWAAIFFALGGWSWVVWGIFVRVSVCVTGHWLIGHFAHRQGGQSWVIDGAAAQGYNVAAAGFVSMGESWHNNHHAFPGSARMGLLPGQVDLGWWLIRTFKALDLATNIKTPENLPMRRGLRSVTHAGGGRSAVAGLQA